MVILATSLHFNVPLFPQYILAFCLFPSIWSQFDCALFVRPVVRPVLEWYRSASERYLAFWWVCRFGREGVEGVDFFFKLTQAQLFGLRLIGFGFSCRSGSTFCSDFCSSTFSAFLMSFGVIFRSLPSSSHHSGNGHFVKKLLSKVVFLNVRFVFWLHLWK